MKYLKKFNLFLEENNPNTPQGYLDSLSKSKSPTQKQKPNQKPNQKPTDDMDSILKNAEEQKQNVVAKKDAIEKGLLNNIRDLEPENQKDVQDQVKDYRNQAQEFDKTVKQIGKLNQTLKKSDKEIKQKAHIQNARDKTKF